MGTRIDRTEMKHEGTACVACGEGTYTRAGDGQFAQCDVCGHNMWASGYVATRMIAETAVTIALARKHAALYSEIQAAVADEIRQVNEANGYLRDRLADRMAEIAALKKDIVTDAPVMALEGKVNALREKVDKLDRHRKLNSHHAIRLYVRDRIKENALRAAAIGSHRILAEAMSALVLHEHDLDEHEVRRMVRDELHRGVSMADPSTK